MVQFITKDKHIQIYALIAVLITHIESYRIVSLLVRVSSFELREESERADYWDAQSVGNLLCANRLDYGNKSLQHHQTHSTPSDLACLVDLYERTEHWAHQVSKQ